MLGFFRVIGIKSLGRGLYRWTVEESLQAMKEGIVDGISTSTIPFSFGKQSIDAIRMRDKELGERLRKATLEGFEVK